MSELSFPMSKRLHEERTGKLLEQISAKLPNSTPAGIFFLHVPKLRFVASTGH